MPRGKTGRVAAKRAKGIGRAVAGVIRDAIATNTGLSGQAGSAIRNRQDQIDSAIDDLTRRRDAQTTDSNN